MLSPTREDMKTFGYGGPNDMREVSRKTLNIWVGATSPLWAPFWVASSFGVGVWAAAQAFKRAQVVPTDTTDVAGTVQDMVREGLIAPMQVAKAVEQIVGVVAEQTPSPQTIAEQLKTIGEPAAETVESTFYTASEVVDNNVAAAEATADVTREAATKTVAAGADLAAKTVADAKKTMAETTQSAANLALDSNKTMAKAAGAAGDSVVDIGKTVTKAAADTTKTALKATADIGKTAVKTSTDTAKTAVTAASAARKVVTPQVAAAPKPTSTAHKPRKS